MFVVRSLTFANVSALVSGGRGQVGLKIKQSISPLRAGGHMEDGKRHQYGSSGIVRATDILAKTLENVLNFAL